jgi:hypothetical protein
MNTSDENQQEYPLPPRELAWDMARAEARIQDARLKKDKALELLVVPKEMRDELAQQAIDAAHRLSGTVEQEYYSKLATRDERYFEIEEQYGSVTLNKEDLAMFLETLSDPSDEKTRKANAQLTTRVWNAIGQLSEWPNSDVKFGITSPTGIQKQHSFSKRGWANTEKIDYIDLNFAGLVHYVDSIAEYLKQRKPYKPIDKTTQTILDFVDYVKAGVANKELVDS